MAEKSRRRELAERAKAKNIEEDFNSLLNREVRTFVEQSIAPNPNHEDRINAEFRMIVLCALKAKEEDPSVDPVTDWFPVSLAKIVPVYEQLTSTKVDATEFTLIPRQDIRRLGRLASALVVPAGSYSLAEVITGFEEGYLRIDI